VQEDDVLILAPSTLPDQRDQSRQALTGINRIERKRFEFADEADGFDGGIVSTP
jgi:hypothetical protein